MEPLDDPAEVWERLPPAEWDGAAASHLLRRTGWTARADDVRRAQEEGLDRTLERLFPVAPIPFPKPELLERFEADLPELQEKARVATGAEKLTARRELRERSQAALQELRIAWLQMAAAPKNASFAKWVLFLSDVYVVSAEKVRNANFIWKHFDILSTHALGPAPELTKAVSRSPAMAMYLDLARSGKKAPNENFARELFELFVLGEGHYTERDIKEAARAFTGYRVDPTTGAFRFAARQHDDGRKIVFGKTAAFAGDDVIDVAYEQPGAAEFLPRELARFYLADEPLPAPYLAALGAVWRESGFDLRTLVRRFFGSRLFFAPQFRGNLIKSPVQFYLGLLHDLDLNVTPLARYSTTRLRQMGQQLFQPPNVRGWIGGRMWISSSTLAVRRQLVQQLFTPLREETLNADEQRTLAETRARGIDNFVVSDAWFETHAAGSPEDISLRLTESFLAGDATESVVRTLRDYLAKGPHEQRSERLRTAAIALLQTPDYQLC
jgi:uncharacterized protein (DUF1800 family)